MASKEEVYKAFLSGAFSTDLTRAILKKLDIEDIKNNCRAKGMEKVCTSLFWLEVYKAKFGKDLNEVFIKAAYYDNIEVIQLLLKNKNIDVFKIKNDVIKAAVENDSLNVVKFLLKNKIIDLDDLLDYSILELAVKNNSLDLIKYLLRLESTEIDDILHPMLEMAIDNQNIGIVNLILKDKRIKKTNIDGSDLLDMAAVTNNTELVKLLLDNSKISNAVAAALFTAIKNNNFEMFKLLVDKGGIFGNTSLNDVVSDGNLKMLKYILKNKKVNVYGNEEYEGFNALDVAVTKNKTYMVKTLLADGRINPVNSCDSIEKAAKKGYIDVLILLLKDPRMKNSKCEIQMKIKDLIKFAQNYK